MALTAQMLEWYTSTLEVRMPQGVGVRISFWVQKTATNLVAVFYYSIPI